jgi:hypothetical protein
MFSHSIAKSLIQEFIPLWRDRNLQKWPIYVKKAAHFDQILS